MSNPDYREIDKLVEAIRAFTEVDDYAPYFISIEQEPNSNLYWIKLNKMYDEDFVPIHLTSVHGESGMKLYQSAERLNDD